MKLTAFCLVVWYSVCAAASAAPTVVKLNEGLAGDGWGMPRINNSGQIIMTERNSSTAGGAPWFYDGSVWAAVPNTASVSNTDGINWRMNNNGRFIYIDDSSSHRVHVADANGDIAVSSTNNHYACAINDSNIIATTRYENYTYHAKVSSDMLVTSTALPHDWINYKTVDINNAGQVAYKYGGYYAGNGSAYLYSPEVGTTTLNTGAASSPVDIDGAGHVFYGSTDGWLYLNKLPVYQMPNTIYSGGLAISDNGHMVWTQWVDDRYDVWTFINNVPTNITAGMFGINDDAFYPDINDNGDIVFMVTTGTFTSDIYLYSVPEPVTIMSLVIGGLMTLRRRR